MTSATDPKALESRGYFYAVLLLACFLAVASLYYVFNGHLNADEGFYLAASSSVRQGFRPFRDFGFTQMPLLAFANVPFLEFFGYTLRGLRGASLAWTSLAIIGGTVWLHQRGGWKAACLFLAALGGAPNWLAYSVKGKTYGFASVCILLGVVVLMSRWRWSIKWIVFAMAAAAGIGARLTLAPFFLCGGGLLLYANSDWKMRCAGILFAGLLAAVELFAFAAGSWDNLLFWTMDFHRQSTLGVTLAARLGDVISFVPSVILGCIGALYVGYRVRAHSMCAVVMALLITAAANLATKSTYAEYIFPLVPSLLMIAADSERRLGKNLPRIIYIALCGMLAIPGWLRSPALDSGVLVEAREAETFLRQNLPAGSTVISSMPEIAVAAGMNVPLTNVMGKFGVTEEMSSPLAAKRVIMTTSSLQVMLEDEATQAVVLSIGRNWNFSWSLPSYRLLSQKAQFDIRTSVMKNFELALTNNHYVILLRRTP